MKARLETQGTVIDRQPRSVLPAAFAVVALLLKSAARALSRVWTIPDRAAGHRRPLYPNDDVC